MNIGSNIKFFRKQRGLTQKQLAEKIGATDSAVTRYESNNREPNIDILTKIANTLGIPVSDLLKDDTINLTDSDTEKVEVHIDVIMGKPELKPLINIFKSKGYELRQEMKGCDIYLLKNKEAVAKIPERDFAEFGAKMLYVINEFTDFEFSKLVDVFTILS